MNNMIQDMIDWIEEHLFEGFSLMKLSEAMGYSSYYCSFKFHQITGISIKRYMTLRKTYLSSISLRDTDERIIEIAIKHGYSSQEAFSRAFKEIFGVTPNAFRLCPKPLQSYVKLTMNEARGYYMDISKKLRIEDLQKHVDHRFDYEVLNILNGQMMYEQFSSQQLMGKSDYAPFNEAMCVSETVKTIFGDSFKQVRAAAHKVSLTEYETITVAPLEKTLFSKKYQCIVLWFGEDMFCQMNLITILAYLEQISFKGTIYYHAVSEQTYDVKETEITLGNYYDIYKAVLLEHRMPYVELLPVMYQGIKLYLELLQSDNEITKYIQTYYHLPHREIVRNLLHLFPQYGLGDSQYFALIKATQK
ncbi:AraC family transcriptional regulator [Lysinibacillus sphaericus]|uniref:AraC family transcriptional regulator n=1 Tax=Lysinibacillus sphaericus TaxID=1421 RepID=A0A544USY6_LYSSH|nr:AraC family transcriptional regulator [Lysinibacillus sp. SDF0037]TQR36959.1 AraC family transcriptional regulator [Lysinibacillus sp. SDF0037]